MKVPVHDAGLAPYGTVKFDPIIGKVMLITRKKNQTIMRGGGMNIGFGREFWKVFETT